MKEFRVQTTNNARGLKKNVVGHMCFRKSDSRITPEYHAQERRLRMPNWNRALKMRTQAVEFKRENTE